MSLRFFKLNVGSTETGDENKLGLRAKKNASRKTCLTANDGDRSWVHFYLVSLGI